MSQSAAPFADRLLESVLAKRSVVVVGLDPRLDDLPSAIREDARRRYGPTPEAVAEAFINFNRRILAAVADICVAVKPQAAFYECYGEHGWRAFAETVAMAREYGLPVIADAKRHDIGTTAEMYARGFLGEVPFWDGSRLPGLGADALTVSAFFGSDGMDPFLSVCREHGRGLFVLVRTSNPSAGEIQDLPLATVRRGDPGDLSTTVSSEVARRVAGWNRGSEGRFGYGPVGAVVGATAGDQAGALRAMMPNAVLLVPGYGTQGASAQDVVPCFDEQGLGAVVNSSRGILNAYQQAGTGPESDGGGFDKQSRAAAAAMRDEINQALVQAGKAYW